MREKLNELRLVIKYKEKLGFMGKRKVYTNTYFGLASLLISLNKNLSYAYVLAHVPNSLFHGFAGTQYRHAAYLICCTPLAAIQHSLWRFDGYILHKNDTL